jgi:hypothetical protein
MKILMEYDHMEAEFNGVLSGQHTDFRKQNTEMDKILLQLILVGLEVWLFFHCTCTCFTFICFDHVQMACKSEKTERALDLTKMLHMQKSIDAAVQIALHSHCTNLAEQMNALKKVHMLI